MKLFVIANLCKHTMSSLIQTKGHLILKDIISMLVSKTLCKKGLLANILQRNFYRGAQLKEGAKEAITELAKKYDVYICTAYYMNYVRELCGKIVEQKYEFIAREMPDFNMSKILFTNSKNVVVGDIIIDDNVNNLLTNKSYQKLLFTAEHNESMSDDELRAHNLVRVNNWADILKILM